MMTIANDLLLTIAVGTTQRTSPLSPSPAGRAIQRQTHEMAVLESLVALGAMQHRRQSGPRGCWIQTCGEITQSIIAELSTDAQIPARLRSHQRLNGQKSPLPQDRAQD